MKVRETAEATPRGVKPRRALLVVAALGLLCAAAPAMEEAEKLELAREGNQLFRQANETVATDPEAAQELYRKAVLRFERIVKEGGVENGMLYYNIGNAYFRMKDIGRAILNYRRAEQYIPNDPNLHQNLQYARSRRIDAIEEQQQKRILKTLFFWHYDLSPRVRSTLFSVVFVLFWAGALVRLFVRRPALSRGLVLLLLVVLLTGGSVVAELIHHQRVRPGVLLAREIVARKGDSMAYERSFKEPLHAGTEFILVEDRGDWYHIELMDGRRCWVPASKAEWIR